MTSQSSSDCFSFYNKVGCVFPMVISPDFRVGQHRDNDHQEDAPHFTCVYNVLKFSVELSITSAILYVAYDQLSVPVVGRSMTPQFNPHFADYGDTVFFLPRILKSEKLKRGKIYLFNDPTKT